MLFAAVHRAMTLCLVMRLVVVVVVVLRHVRLAIGIVYVQASLASNQQTSVSLATRPTANALGRQYTRTESTAQSERR